MAKPNNATMFFVSRQHYYYSGEHIVEIATGGCDYAGSDMLATKYSGEGCEYDDPREAVKAAIEIRDAWKADKPKLEIEIAAGSTGGMGIELEPQDSDEELVAWAEKAYEKLPKCDRCGKPLGKEHYTLKETDEKFCSEFCAEESYAALFPSEEELQEA